jgi:hypothetical protein
MCYCLSFTLRIWLTHHNYERLAVQGDKNMMWQRYRLRVWFRPSPPNWWPFGDPLDGFQLLNQPELQLQRRQHLDGWIDFFLGKAAMENAVSRCSCIDSHRKIALHYLKEDLDCLGHLPCPSRIPKSLWKLLQLKARQKDPSSSHIWNGNGKTKTSSSRLT